MISDIIKKIEPLAVDEAIKALVEGLAFEFASAGIDPDKQAALQVELSKTASKIVSSALAGSVAGSGPTPIADKVATEKKGA